MKKNVRITEFLFMEAHRHGKIVYIHTQNENELRVKLRSRIDVDRRK